MIVSPDITLRADYRCARFPKKLIYSSRVSAQDAASKVRVSTGESIRAYRCGSHWHMGHPDRKPKGAA